MMEQKRKRVKKHRKLWVFIAALAVLAILVGVLASGFRRRREQMTALLNQTETATVERRTLVSSISATGVINSTQSKEVKADVSGVKVKTIPVEVGDYVKPGDLLCELDTVDLEESLKDAKTSFNNASAKANIDVANAQRSLTEAQTARDIQNARNEQAVEDAWEDYAEAADQVNSLNEQLNALKASQDEKAKAIAVKEKEIKEAQESSAAAGSAGEAGTAGGTAAAGTGTAGDPAAGTTAAAGDPAAGTTAASGALAAGNAARIAELTAQLQALQAELQVIQNAVTAKQAEITQAEKSRDALWSAYVKSAEAKEDGIRNNDSSVLNKESSLETAKLNAAVTGKSDKQQMETYEEQIAACTVLAPISGVVTAVYLEVGDNYNGTAILTIEDDSAFIVEAEIDEYDIGKIRKGQEVVIKTNATGEEELSGTVIHVAPRASGAVSTGTSAAGASTAASQGSSVTYRIKISVDTSHEMLRMDMTAKLSIVLEKKADVLTVPYGAVCEDEDGNFYVEVLDETEEASAGKPSSVRIYVTRGIESDYYVEVSGEGLEEGMEVAVPQTESGTSLMEIRARMLENGPMGGF